MTYQINLTYQIEADTQIEAITKATTGQAQPQSVNAREMSQQRPQGNSTIVNQQPT